MNATTAPRFMPSTLALRKIIWHYGQGTELRLVNYRPGGSVFLQNVGEDDNGVIELPEQLRIAVAGALAPELLTALQHATETLSAEGFDVAPYRALIGKITGSTDHG